MEHSFVTFLRGGDTAQLLRQMRQTGWRVSFLTCDISVIYCHYSYSTTWIAYACKDRID